MANTPGAGLVLSSGKGGVLANGKGALFNVDGECLACCCPTVECQACTDNEGPETMLLQLNAGAYHELPFSQCWTAGGNWFIEWDLQEGAWYYRVEIGSNDSLAIEISSPGPGDFVYGDTGGPGSHHHNCMDYDVRVDDTVKSEGDTLHALSTCA